MIGARSGSLLARLPGLIGILVGALLLAAFIVDIPPDLNHVRLVTFNAGAAAIVVAVYRRQASAAPTLALIGALPAIATNAWHLVMVVLATGQAAPFAGDFGFAFFIASAAMWLADSLFGLVALRLGTVNRLAGLALAIGSVLAMAGMDRLELTSPDNPTIFGPIALIGIALNGIGWVLVGIEIVINGHVRVPTPNPA